MASDDSIGLRRRALDHNGDDGIDVPLATLRDPDCDRGTAFLLLWRSYTPLGRLMSDGGRAIDVTGAAGR